MIEVIRDTREENVWIKAVHIDENGDKREFEAKVYDTPSEYGVKGCRVSKLTIQKKNVGHLYGTVPYFDLCDYNYDRDLDFNYLHNQKGGQKVLKEILEFCNKLDTPWLDKENKRACKSH